MAKLGPSRDHPDVGPQQRELSLLTKNSKGVRPPGSYLISKAQVAYMLAVDERTVTRYQSQPNDPLPVAYRGRNSERPSAYDPRDVSDWEVRRRQAKLRFGGDGELLDFERERARLTREQADNQALKNTRARNELMPVDVVRWALRETGRQIGQIIGRLPAKIAKRVELVPAGVECVRLEVKKAQAVAANLEHTLDDFAADDQPDP